MNSDVQDLISRANTLVIEETAKGERRKRYSPELRSIVRSLVLKHKFSVPQTIAVIPVSHASVRKWSQKNSRERKAKPMFKKISLKGQHDNIADRHLSKITVALGLLIVSQALTLAFLLFLL